MKPLKTSVTFRPLRFQSLLLGSLLVFTASVQAADQIWTGASSLDWDTTTANWLATGTTTPPVNWADFDIAHFTESGSGKSVTVTGNQTANGLSFEATGYTVQGGTLTLGSPTGGPSVSVDSGFTATLSNLSLVQSTGIANWNKGGAGTLIFNGVTSTNSRALNLLLGTTRIETGTTVTGTGALNFNNGGGSAIFEMTDGSYTTTGNVTLGSLTGGGTSTFNQSGGSFAMNTGTNNQMNLANNGGTSVMNLSGGTFFSKGFFDGLVIGQRGTATLNITGTAAATTGIIQFAGVGAASGGTLNLNGGSLTTTAFTRNATGSGGGTFNFNGGQLKAGAASATYITNLTRANVRDGGAKIDTNSFAITIAQPLLHSNLNGDAAVDGGLTKSGAGTLTLTGASTYTGTTTISGGTLVLGAGGSVAASPLIQVDAAGTLQAGSYGTGQTVQGTGTLAGAITFGTGSSLSPGTAGTIGSMAVTGTTTLNGRLQIDLVKSGASLTADQLTGAGAIVFGGALEVVASGDTPVLGDTFTVFTNLGSRSGSFTSLVLPTLPAGLSWDRSNLAANGTLKVVNRTASPAFSLSAGNYVGTQTVTITSEPGATIYYTMDGSTPTTSSPSGASPVGGLVIPADATTTIRAFAVKPGVADSQEETAIYHTIGTARWTFNGSGLWSNAADWQQNIIPDNAGAAVDFFTTAQTTDATVTLDSSRTVGSLAFGNANPINWTISATGGSVLTLDAVAPSISVAARTATIAAPIAGANGLTKTGAGTLVLSGANSYGGATTVTEGVLKLGAANVLPDGAGKGNLILAGTLDLNAFSDTVNGLSGNGFVDQGVAGTSTFTVGANNAGGSFGGVIRNTLGTVSLVKSGSGTLALTNANTYSGSTTLTGGTIEIPTGGSIGTATSGKVQIDSGTLRLSGGSITSNGNGVIFLGNAGPSTFDFSAGTVTLNAASQYWDAVIGNFAPGVWNQSGGTAILNVDDLYLGNNAGSAGSALNISGGTLSVNGAATAPGRRGLILGVRSSSSVTLSGTAEVTVLDVLFGYQGNTPAGVVSTFNLDGGTFHMKSASNSGGRTAVFNFNGGLLKAFADSATFMSGLTTANIRNGGARIDTAGHAINLDQPLLHSDIAGDNALDGGLVKSGAGVLTLGGTSSYTGGTSVTGGSLLINGALGTGAVTVNSAATLGGSGAISGITSIAGTLAPGGTPITTGTLSLKSTTLTGTYECQFDGATSDQIAVEGDLDLNGATIHLSEVNPATAPEFVIATYTGTLSAATTPPVLTGLSDYDLVIDTTLKQLRVKANGGVYGAWAGTKGLTEGNNGKVQDADDDGSNNFAEFALNGDPLSGMANARYVLKQAGVTHGDSIKRTVLTLTLPVRQGASFSAVSGELVSGAVDRVIYRIQGSLDLADWTTLPVAEVTDTAERNAIQTNVTPAEAGWTNRTFYIPFSLSADKPKAFLRARIVEGP